MTGLKHELVTPSSNYHGTADTRNSFTSQDEQKCSVVRQIAAVTTPSTKTDNCDANAQLFLCRYECTAL
jgi:hypothetical protein